ncbi:MAG: isoprenylcysteine carboxylmethyltransferase family protein [Deltaproteobacteria bacterium]|nr:isoprenylcysteine carboxylmethyltransferase family protein [Deltaproteobacteria bacterium]
METADRLPGIDFKKFFIRLYSVLKSKRGELMAVAVFGFFMVQDFRAVFRHARIMVPLSFLNIVVFLNGLLVAGYFTMLVCIYLSRGAAGSTTRSLPAKLVALVATFMPFTFPVLSGAAPSGVIILMVSSLILLLGMIFTLVALGTLGRSFSLIPQTRKLVTGGPYRLVRHPVYVGEIIGALGLVVWAASIPKSVVFVLLVGCEVYRALQEEKLLAEVFPEYREYASKTRRFIPGIF